MKYETLEEYTQKRMKNKNFAKEYEAIQPEMNIIRAIIDARTSRNLTQQELADYMKEKLEPEVLSMSRIAIKLFKSKQIKLHLKD